MKKSDILIFLFILIVIIIIFIFSIWNANNDLNEFNSVNQIKDEEINNEQTNIITEKETNIEEATLMNNNINYDGKWYISEEAYLESEKVEEIIEKKEDNEISDSEYENQIKTYINKNIVELDIDKYVQNTLEFDFSVINYSQTPKEAKLENIGVNLNGNIGTFTYTDNLGTSGNGTITLKENQIELRLETNKAEQGVTWSVEGMYTFSYKKVD